MTASQTDMTVHEDELNQMLVAGRFMEAYERFYADDVTMQENTTAPCVGKEANLQRQLLFYNSVREFHSARLLGSATNVQEGRAFSEWEYDMTFHNGSRYTLAEVAVRQWLHGKVVHERFYWDLTGYPGPL
jgi:hypothetical protein